VQSASDCDYGRPYLKIKGKYICKYFGKFKCICENIWSSAHCWKGMTQSCQGCNRENIPIWKKQLDRRRVDNSNGSHDCSRCAMRRRLGNDCMGRSYFQAFLK